MLHVILAVHLILQNCMLEYLTNRQRKEGAKNPLMSLKGAKPPQGWRRHPKFEGGKYATRIYLYGENYNPMELL